MIRELRKLGYRVEPLAPAGVANWGERGFFDPVRAAFPVIVAGRRPHHYF